MGTQKPQVSFTRDATGLVREFSHLDMLLMAGITIFALSYTTVQFPWFYGFNPGANLPTSLLIAGIPVGLLMLVYWAIGVIMPRSGSDYVWVGRVLSPAVGFAWSALFMFAVLIAGYLAVASLLDYVITGLLSVWGILYNVPPLEAAATFLGTPTGSFIIVTILTIFSALLGIIGAKIIKPFIFGGWLAAVIGLALIWGIMGTASPNIFADKWNAFFSQYTSYSGMIQAATKVGWTPTTVSIAASVASLPFATLFLLGGTNANMAAGEIKHVRKALPIALLGSLILSIVLWVVTAQTTLNATGSNWMSAVGYMYDNNPAAYNSALPYAPTLPLMVSIVAYPNQALIFLVLITFLLGSIPTPFVYLWFPSRYLFAWSFDRVIPTKVADVNDRFRSPHMTILVTAILAELLAGLYFFTGFASAFTIGTYLWEASWVVVGLAVMVFPFVKKDMLTQAPSFMQKRIAGIPVLSLLGALAMLLFAYEAYLALTNPLLASSTTIGSEIALAVVATALVIYYGSLVYHRRSGLDLRLALRVLPPE